MSEMNKTLEQRGVANKIASTWRFLEKAHIPDAGKRPGVEEVNRKGGEHVSMEYNAFTELLFSFKEQLKVKNFSPGTIANYSYHLSDFFDHLKAKEIADITRVTKDVLTDYQEKIAEQKGVRTGSNFASSTISMKVRAIKRFFKYLEDTSQVLVNPAEELKEPRAPKRLPRAVLNSDEVRKILDQPALVTPLGIRDRAVLEVFYSTGIRREEMASLTIFDCDLQGGMLRVKGKFSKDRVVPLGKHAVRFLKEYITRIRPHHTRTNKQLKTLFVNQRGAGLSKTVIGIIVRTYARQAGTGKKVSPHTFRHTFATELIRNGADITAVRKMLGHADLSATNVYTHVAGTDVKKTHAERHPREKDKEQKEDASLDIRRLRGQDKKKGRRHE